MNENRKYIIITVFCLVVIVYLSRLFYLQILDDSYALESSSNSIKRIIEVPYRGQIYDRNGKLIVSNSSVYDLYVTPKKVVIQDTVAFCRLMGLERPEFDSIMATAKAYSLIKPSLFLRQLSKEDFARIQDALVDYRGFEHVTSSMRTYPARTLANSLGYVSQVTRKQLDEQETPYYRQGDYIGHSGLEEQYESILRGRRGIKFVMQNVRGINKGSWKNGAFDSLAVAGQSLYTGIDLTIQQYADTLMQNKIGSVVAIEPATGQILCMVSAPSYDPNLLTSRYFSKNYTKLMRNPYRPLINRPVMASYRPGSTFKMIQALVGLQEGVITPYSTFSHAGVPMKCHGHPGGIHLDGAVQYSCNPYFYRVFQKLMYNNLERNTFRASAVGLEHWHEMVSKFGIGQRLGVDLPSELKGKLPDVEYYNKVYGTKRWKFSTIYSLSIGEGELLISPMKMANVAAILANRGYFYTPHLVNGIGKANENLPEPYGVRHDVGIRPEYFKPVLDGMQMVVDHPGGTAHNARIPDIVMCGKTGTSQNRRGEDHSIFIAFAPRENPKIAIAVFVENAGAGGRAAAPIASLVIEKYLKGKVNKGLERSVLKMNFLPGATQPKKWVPRKPDQSGDSTAPAKPMMVKAQPGPGVPVHSAVQLEVKPLAPKPVNASSN